MKKIFILLSLVLICSAGALTAYSASKYNVYSSPTVYKQSTIKQAPLKVDGAVIELVVDYSGSMATWIALAKQMLVSILPQITENTYVGLRVFGHKTSTLMSGCKATTVVSRAKKLNTDGIIGGLNSTSIGGVTPLTYALQQTVYQDFAGLNLNVNKKIILVTDGVENCGGDPCAFIRNLMKTRQDIVVDVIMVNGSDSLRCLSDNSGGKYYNTLNAVDFNDALNKTFGASPEPVNINKPYNGKVYNQFIN